MRTHIALLVSACALVTPVWGQQPSVERIEIASNATTAYAGTSLPLSVDVWTPGGARPERRAAAFWESSNAELAWVTDDGLVVFWKPGTVRITARVGPQSATRSFEVLPNPVAKLTLRAEGATDVRPGDTVRLRVDALDRDGRPVPEVRVRFGVAAARAGQAMSGAAVTRDGAFVAREPGIYTVIAEAGGRVDKTLVLVRPPAPPETQAPAGGQALTPLRFADVRFAPYVGTSVPLTLVAGKDAPGAEHSRPVRWRSSAPDVAAVSAEGVVSFLRPGRAVITADDGVFQLTKRFDVVPNPAARLVVIARLQTEGIFVGDEVRLKVQTWARGGQPIKDARLNYAVVSEGGVGTSPSASVSDEGVFVASKPGLYTVIVELGGEADMAIIDVRERRGS